jgi:hypothetical protein
MPVELASVRFEPVVFLHHNNAPEGPPSAACC